MKLSRLLSIVKLGIDVLLSEHLQSRSIDSSDRQWKFPQWFSNFPNETGEWINIFNWHEVGQTLLGISVWEGRQFACKNCFQNLTLLGIGKAHFVQTHKDFGVFLKINHISQHACFCSCPSQGNVFNSSGLGSFEWRNSVFAKWIEINEVLLWGLRIFIQYLPAYKNLYLRTC